MTVKNITSFEGIKTDTGDKEVEHFMNVVCNGSTMEPLDSQYRVEDRPVSVFGASSTSGLLLADVFRCVCPTPMRETLKAYCTHQTTHVGGGGTADMYGQWMPMSGPYTDVEQFERFNHSYAGWCETDSLGTAYGMRPFPFFFNNGSCQGVHHKLRHLKTIQTASFVLSFYVTEKFRYPGFAYDNQLPGHQVRNIDANPTYSTCVNVVVSPCFYVRCVFKDVGTNPEYTGINGKTRCEWFAFPLSWEYLNNEIKHTPRSEYRNLEGTDTPTTGATLAATTDAWYETILPTYNYSACECNSVDSPFCYVSMGPILGWVGMNQYGNTGSGEWARAMPRSGTIPDPGFTPTGGPANVGVQSIGSSGNLWYENEDTPVITALFNSPCDCGNAVWAGIGDNAYYDPEASTVDNGWTCFTYLSEINHSESDSDLEQQQRYIKYYDGSTEASIEGPVRSSKYDEYCDGVAKFHKRNWSLTFFNQRLFALDLNSGYMYASNAGIESEFVKDMFLWDETTTTHTKGQPATQKSDLPNMDEIGDWFSMDSDGVYRTKIWGWYGKPSSSSGLAKQIHSSDNTLYLVYDSSVDTYALSNLSDQPITMTYQNTHSPNGVFNKIFHDGSIALLFENCGLGIKVYKFNEDGSLALVSNAEMEKRLYRHCKNLQCTTYLSNGKRFVAILADDKSYAYLYDVNGGYWTEMNLFNGSNFVSFYLSDKTPATMPVNSYEDNDGYWSDSHRGQLAIAPYYGIFNTRFFVGRKFVPNFTCSFTSDPMYTDHIACGTAGFSSEGGTSFGCYVTTAPSFYGKRQALTYVQVVGDNKNEDSTKTSSDTTWTLAVSFDNGKTFNNGKTRVKGIEQRMDKDIEWRALGSGNNSAIKITAEGVKEDSQVYAINTEVK